MSTLTLVVVCVCVFAAISLAGYSLALLRRKQPPVIQTLVSPVPDRVVSAPTPALPLPGIPPKYVPPVPTWGAVERQLDAPRLGRGTKPPPPPLQANRFDQVLTTG